MAQGSASRPSEQGAGRRARPRRRRAGGVLLGTLLAVLVGWSPMAVQPALAAGPLLIRADTRYVVDPDAGRVHVTIDFTVTNNKPSTATVIYYYRTLNFGIQPDVREVRASDRGGNLRVSTRQRTDFTEVDVRLRADLLYRRSASFTLRYDLVGGAPRSDSPIRVGKAFATFGVWGFGDPNRGTVEVRLPAGFAVTVDGDEMEQSGGVGTGTTLRADPPDPNEFFAIVSADDEANFEEQRISLPGGVEIIVLSWPEDDAWAEQVATTMERGVPELQQLIGLDWPVRRDLRVQERYTPSLEGYAGVFFEAAARIDMSEDLDPITTLHEASHAWFNDGLFRERWITEGLAEEYSYRVDELIGGGPYDPPVRPDPEDEGFVRLNAWRFPEIVREETDAIEAYGYGASSWLMNEIVEAAGLDRMREAFRLADANVTAYPGAGAPEHVAVFDDWRRFLDLVQPIDRTDPESILDAIEQLVLADGEDDILERRAEARDAYRALLADADGWLPPWYVRGPLGEWRFDDTIARVGEAAAVLALRDEVEAAATTEGLTLDDALKAAYEGAQDGFDGAEKVVADQLAAIAAIADARGRVYADRDLMTQLGLIGETPTAPYEAARAAFEAGDLGAAVAQAGQAAGIVAGAAAVGEGRLLVGGAVSVGVLVLLVVAVLLIRRRRRRAAVASASTASGAALDATFAAPPAASPVAPPAAPTATPSSGSPPAAAAVPSGTLGADPERTAAPTGAPAPDPEGGEPL